MTKPQMISFGEYVRKLRENAGLPLRKVAAQLDIDPSFLAKIERNERQPAKSVIIQIAKIFRQDEQAMLIEFLSDRIAYQVMDEESGMKALKVAEQKVKYFKNRARTKK